LILAHRGDWLDDPENSLGAFVAAAARPGLDGVEFDVRLAGDGTPVVIHDAGLGRVQGVDQAVAELSAAELAELGVPDLATVVAALPEPRFLDIELKEDVGAAVVRMLAGLRGDPPRAAVLSSFLPEAISTSRRIAPDWPCWLNSWQLSPEVIEAARSLGCYGIAAEWHALTPATVAQVRDAGLGLGAWTVPDQATLAAVVAMGIDFICVDPPAIPDSAG
jgi:glycerophosphoryl diester phosphodiesterase